MRFLVRILGARTPPPRMDAPVTNIPLDCAQRQQQSHGQAKRSRQLVSQSEITAQAAQPCSQWSRPHHPAPTTLRPMLSPTPVIAHACGDVFSRKEPTLKTSPEPVLYVVERRGRSMSSALGILSPCSPRRTVAHKRRYRAMMTNSRTLV